MYNYNPYMNYQQPRTDIGQVNNEQEAVNAYVAAGCSRIMFTPDDSTVFVKCVSMNGQTTLDIFDKRTVRPENCDTGFVTHKELSEALDAIKGAYKAKEKGAAE